MAENIEKIDTEQLVPPCNENDDDFNIRTGKLSTFLGVVVPCILSIFSVILFLRLGFCIGQAGYLTVMGMFILAYAIVCLTVISLSAIATNGTVKGGGAYFMISRALGPELGGSIGVIFYFANVFASALYVIGFTEAMVNNFGPQGELAQAISNNRWWEFLYGSVVLLFCLIVCIFGAGLFAKTSLVIFLAVMVAVVSSLVSFFAQGSILIHYHTTYEENETAIDYNYTSWSLQTFHDNLLPDYTKDITTNLQQNFQTVFAVLFNGCTGIMAGANISGDLKNPSKAIPSGTVIACGVTFIIYVVLVTFTSFTCSRGLLQNDYNYIQAINLVPPIITVGVFAATLSAALSTLIGASRILEAVARDDIIGILTRPFAVLTRRGEPLRAVLFSWLLVQIILLAQKLNAIAPIVTMFYLLSYAAINFSCFLLKVASPPNFRPTFRFYSWPQAFLGLVGCLGLMFFVDAVYATISIAVMIVLFIFISLRGPVTPWGDLSQAVIYHQVRKYLLRLDIRKEHVKYWRPQILLLVANPRSCYSLIDFVNSLKKGGLYILGNVIVGNFVASTLARHCEQFRIWLDYVDQRHLKAFVEITVADSVRAGARSLMLTSGLGGMKPNTIVLGFYDDSLPHDTEDHYLQDILQANNNSLCPTLFRRKKNGLEGDFRVLTAKFPPLRFHDRQNGLTSYDYVGIIEDALNMKKNVLIVRNFHNLRKATSQTIDLWPFGSNTNHYDDTYFLVLQLGCILHMVPHWSNMQLRLLITVDDNLEVKTKTDLTDRTRKLLKDLRIPAEVKIIELHISCEQQLLPPYNGSVQFAGLTPFERNSLMQEHSSNACVVFTSMPKLPRTDNNYNRFLSDLNCLSENLPPMVMAYGASTVVSTSI